MKGTRKFFSILTALALCLSLLPGTALAAEGDDEIQLQITRDENSNWGTSEGITAGTIKYTAGDNTLTLNGVDLPDKSIIISIIDNALPKLTVQITGENTVGKLNLESLSFTNTTPIILTGDGSFTGNLYSEHSVKIDETCTPTLNSAVRAKNASGVYDVTVYGSAKIAASETISVAGDSAKLTIPTDATLTINSGGELALQMMPLFTYINSAEKGTIVNNGTVSIPDGWHGRIGDLNLRGSGRVQTTYDSEVTGIYGNDGVKVPIQPLNATLTLSTTDADSQFESGYKWNAGTRTLTLYDGFDANGQTISFPDNSAIIKVADRSTAELSGNLSFTAPGGTFTTNTGTGSKLLIPEGETLTLNNVQGLTNSGTIENNGTLNLSLSNVGLTNSGTITNNSTLNITGDVHNADGTITNNGTVALETAFPDANAAKTAVESLELGGSGTVTAKITGSSDSVTFSNEGKQQLTPTGGTLDLSSKTTGEDKLATQGYKWEVLETDPDNTSTITKAKLTLAPGFNATSVTLPETGAINIVTQGEASIKRLACGGSSPNVQLTFSGTGPLTVQEQINIAGGDDNTLTVNQNANVIANGGIYIGASGGVNSIVTVNGNLTATAGSGTVISTGSVAIGETGVLKVSGESGVSLGGMPKNTGAKFNSVFTIADGGCFTANCSTCNLRASTTDPNEFPANAGDAFVIPKDFLPENCEPKLNGDHIDLWNTKTDNVYSGALTIHKYHTWSSDWTADGDNGHYHACTFEGCIAKKDESPHYYAHGAEKCRDCEYPRPAGTPDSDGGSSGGGGGGTSRYTVTVEKASHGEVTSSRRTASRGDTVTLTVTPDSGYALNTLTVTDSRGNEVALTEKGGGAYTFTMPSRAVTVRAAFLPLPDDTNKPCNGGADCPSRAFSDLDTSKWYHQAVDYVLRNNLMCGYGGGLFGPDDNLTRAQFTQILYNKAGRPVVNYLLQYNDVADGAWYTEAVRWAASQGIVSGYGNGMFGPNDNITREQLAVMLWRYAGSPAASDGTLAFTDADAVSEYALEALCWAVENGIVTGRGGGVLDPQGQATRAEAAAMLMRYLGK